MRSRAGWFPQEPSSDPCTVLTQQRQHLPRACAQLDIFAAHENYTGDDIVCTLQALGCSAETTGHIRKACDAGSRSDRSPLSRQFLFTVYPSPEFPGVPPGGLFRGREVADRVAVRAGFCSWNPKPGCYPTTTWCTAQCTCILATDTFDVPFTGRYAFARAHSDVPTHEWCCAFGSA
jgi:hypothetical protein